ncbi:hypothetical protein M9Y10_014241 [Tritrichomonas musculus]|uniref:SGF29 C-terminal domain-containing protein n=1 Tax=Tritrichomonas musculus TaxID=1915356 RepID=A0ABR2KZS9_9EUKA
MMDLKEGQICAACVPYNQSKPEWIITRIEKILPDGNYLVRDEDADATHDERYTVKPSKITQFPSLDTNYQPDDHVLALWYDEPNNVWSTMFYEAIVKEAKPDGKVLIEFIGYSLTVQIDNSKIARFPRVDNPNIDDESTERRVIFTSSPLQMQAINVQKLTNEDFDKLLKPNVPIRRLKSVKGTPLLDFLNDPDLFPEVNPHITTCGSLSLPNAIRAPDKESGLLNPNAHVGRISKILYEWR